jgi:single-strand DNA-binding protein
MSRSLNRATIIGRLGFDPEMKVTPQGSSVCTLKIATNERYKDKNGEWQETTDWHTVVLWDRLADIAGQYLRKGNQVYVEGKIRTRTWEKDGITRYFTEIIANNVLLLGGKNDQGFESAGSYSHEAASSNNNSMGDHLAPDESDDIPF